MKDSWQSVTTIIKWYGDHQDEMIPVAGPGNWNDPDMVTKKLNIWIMGPVSSCPASISIFCERKRLARDTVNQSASE